MPSHVPMLCCVPVPCAGSLLRVEARLLHPKRSDEDVDDDGEEDQCSGHIVYDVQLSLVVHVVEIFTCWRRKKK